MPVHENDTANSEKLIAKKKSYVAVFLKSNLPAVFRILDIFIRIRILGSVLWITEPDPALFGNFQDANKMSNGNLY